jgi:hypothetical protein
MILERILMAQVQAPEKQQLEETPRQGQLCDSCGVRALFQSSFGFGTLYFCLHHYNKLAKALDDKGAVSTPLVETGNITL